MGRRLGRRARILTGLALIAGLVVLTTPSTASATGPLACVKKSPYRLLASSYSNPNFAEFDIPQLQAQGLTGKEVKVAVIDSGISVRGLRWQGAVLNSGKSFVDNKPTTDDRGHGTAVASIIGARQIHKAAPIGVAPGALLLPVKVYSQNPNANVETLAKAIVWATQQHVQVISISLATPDDNPALRSAVRFAEQHDVVVVAADQDQLTVKKSTGQPLDKTATYYPGAYPGVLGVAATGPWDATTARGARIDLERSVGNWNYHGPQVKIAAPGAETYFVDTQGRDCITSSQPYASFSTPYVAGVAALLRQLYPKESAQQIVYRIEASALRADQDKPDNVYGWGVIQPYTAATMTLDPTQAGPPYPGPSSSKQVTSSIGQQRVRSGKTLFAYTDPWQGIRSSGIWWGLGAVLLAAVATICRPLVRRRMTESENKVPVTARRRRAG